jgi:hypothetical protein
MAFNEEEVFVDLAYASQCRNRCAADPRWLFEEFINQ